MDKWFFGFIVFAVVMIGVIASSPSLIIDKIGKEGELRDIQFQKATVERDEQFQQQKLEILNNLSHKLDTIESNIETIIKEQNITFTLNGNQTNGLEKTGSISGIGKPEIIPSN